VRVLTIASGPHHPRPVSVISTIAPGLGRFSLVRMGLPVIHTGRGWDIWTRARDTLAIQ
jgi:hypothetical protein